LTNAFWSLLGYASAFMLVLLPVGGMVLLTKTRAWRRRKRIRSAGWAPWWYIGGQPDVPEELQQDTESEN
jgi:hypothetical protein